MTVTGGGGGDGLWWKKGEGTTQGTGMNDPGTWRTVRGLTAGTQGGLGGGGQGELEMG